MIFSVLVSSPHGIDSVYSEPAMKVVAQALQKHYDMVHISKAEPEVQNRRKFFISSIFFVYTYIGHIRLSGL